MHIFPMQERGYDCRVSFRWKHLVKNEVELKTNALRSKYVKVKSNNCILHSDGIESSLEHIHQIFIITRTDKANWNVSMI